jgi:hypothetical protein
MVAVQSGLRCFEPEPLPEKASWILHELGHEFSQSLLIQREKIAISCNLDPREKLEIVLEPGMSFASPACWWKHNLRLANHKEEKHSGIDLTLVKSGNATIMPIPAGTEVVALAQGAVVSIFKDQVAHTVVCKIPKRSDGQNDLFVYHTHITPADNLHEGKYVAPGEILGRIAPPHKPKISKEGPLSAAPHYHISLAVACSDDSLEGPWSFQYLEQQVKREKLLLLDPAAIMIGDINFSLGNRWKYGPHVIVTGPIEIAYQVARPIANEFPGWEHVKITANPLEEIWSGGQGSYDEDIRPIIINCHDRQDTQATPESELSEAYFPCRVQKLPGPGGKYWIKFDLSKEQIAEGLLSVELKRARRADS